LLICSQTLLRLDILVIVVFFHDVDKYASAGQSLGLDQQECIDQSEDKNFIHLNRY